MMAAVDPFHYMATLHPAPHCGLHGNMMPMQAHSVVQRLPSAAAAASQSQAQIYQSQGHQPACQLHCDQWFNTPHGTPFAFQPQIAAFQTTPRAMIHPSHMCQPVPVASPAIPQSAPLKEPSPQWLSWAAQFQQPNAQSLGVAACETVPRDNISEYAPSGAAAFALLGAKVHQQQHQSSFRIPGILPNPAATQISHVERWTDVAEDADAQLLPAQQSSSFRQAKEDPQIEPCAGSFILKHTPVEVHCETVNPVQETCCLRSTTVDHDDSVNRQKTKRSTEQKEPHTSHVSGSVHQPGVHGSASLLKPRSSSPAEHWVRTYSAQDQPRNGRLEYPSKTVVDMNCMTAMLDPFISANAKHVQGIAHAVARGDHVREGLRVYRVVDEALNGFLMWPTGDVFRFVLQYFHQQGLKPPREPHVHKLYRLFDPCSQMFLEARECICLLDGLLCLILYGNNHNMSPEQSFEKLASGPDADDWEIASEAPSLRLGSSSPKVATPRRHLANASWQRSVAFPAARENQHCNISSTCSSGAPELPCPNTRMEAGEQSSWCSEAAKFISPQPANKVPEPSLCSTECSSVPKDEQTDLGTLPSLSQVRSTVPLNLSLAAARAESIQLESELAKLRLQQASAQTAETVPTEDKGAGTAADSLTARVDFLEQGQSPVHLTCATYAAASKVPCPQFDISTPRTHAARTLADSRPSMCSSRKLVAPNTGHAYLSSDSESESLSVASGFTKDPLSQQSGSEDECKMSKKYHRAMETNNLIGGGQVAEISAPAFHVSLMGTAMAHAENKRLEKELESLRAIARRQRGEALALQKQRAERYQSSAIDLENWQIDEHSRDWCSSASACARVDSQELCANDCLDLLAKERAIQQRELDLELQREHVCKHEKMLVQRQHELQLQQWHLQRIQSLGAHATDVDSDSSDGDLTIPAHRPQLNLIRRNAKYDARQHTSQELDSGTDRNTDLHVTVSPCEKRRLKTAMESVGVLASQGPNSCMSQMTD